MEAIDELVQLSGSMRQVAALLADEDANKNLSSSSSRRGSTFLNVVALGNAFSYFDRDGNGYIERDELRDALMEDGADDCTDVANDIFQEDGRISYDEFVAMMKTGTDWKKASRHYLRGRFNSLSIKLIKDGSLNLGHE
ncbi:Calcium-dependent protein kinase 13 [Vitis vinifera]|uniref:Calcium-dependent protein kinase 13 n=1 Tax=Vitis vinifera TaxID=29760 RepID=A0A438CZN3_VITVI|nr:Calcium-dependent protein kinase 13 [Vitis vinifera]